MAGEVSDDQRRRVSVSRNSYGDRCGRSFDAGRGTACAYLVGAPLRRRVGRSVADCSRTRVLGVARAVKDAEWSGQISWRDRGGYREATHRPDLVIHRNGGHVGLEVELSKKSTERLRAILRRHLVWWCGGATGGVIYVCRDVDGCERIRKVGADIGFVGDRPGLRISCSKTIEAQALAAYEQARAARSATASAARQLILAVDGGR